MSIKSDGEQFIFGRGCMIDEWGISSEPVDWFTTRNFKPAGPIYPQNLLSSQDILGTSNIPFLPIVGFERVDWPQMHSEVKSLENHYVPHRAHESHRGWSSLCLHGLSSVHTEAHQRYGYKNIEDVPFVWTDIAKFCPTLVSFLKNQIDYEKFYRVRIMKLSAGGFIIPHKDSLSEEENRIGPINIALNNPKDCFFFMDQFGYLPFEQGTVMSLNLYNVHCVVNRSHEDRYHLIIHGKRSSEWSQRFYESYVRYKLVYA